MASNKSGFSMDFTEFDKIFFHHVRKTVPNAGLEALDRVTGPLVINDAIKEEPTVPKKTGNLRRTQALMPAKIVGKDIEKIVGFEAEYAAAVHEAPNDRNWSEPGSGSKFIETKLMKNKEKYMNKTAQIIKEITGQ